MPWYGWKIPHLLLNNNYWMTYHSKSISLTCWIYFFTKPLQTVYEYEDYHFRILMIFSYIYITWYLSSKAIKELTNGFSIKTWIALVLNRFHQCYVWNIFTWRCYLSSTKMQQKRWYCFCIWSAYFQSAVSGYNHYALKVESIFNILL